MADPPPRELVLVGAGHAHLHLIAELPRLRACGYRVSVISPGGFWYSGLATGMLAGDYRPRQDRIEVASLVRQGGGTFISGMVRSVDPQRRLLHCADGRSIAYERCSLDVGSRPASLLPGRHPWVVPVKPIAALVGLRRDLLDDRREQLRLVVVGAGLTGCELACCLLGLGRRLGRRWTCTLVGRRGVLPAQPWLPRRLLLRAMRRHPGLRILPHGEARSLREDGVLLADGDRLPADLVVLATGLRAPDWLAASGLPVDEQGAVQVEPSLQVAGHAGLFAAGDCIRFPGEPLAPVGVHAVRGSRVLLRNLCALQEGTALQPFTPQRRYLAIVNTGDGRGVAMYGPLAVSGRWAWRLKDRIDRTWIRGYRQRIWEDSSG